MAEMPTVSYRGRANGASEEIRGTIVAQMLAGREGGSACHKKKITNEAFLSTAQQGQGGCAAKSVGVEDRSQGFL